jgi:hypothetical protein
MKSSWGILLLLFVPAWSATPQQPSEAPSGIRLQTFRGGQTYVAGTGRIIAVQTVADLALVKVEFSESGGSWRLLGDEVQIIKGGFLWKLPKRSIPKGRLRVSYKDPQEHEFSDQSEKDFAVDSSPVALQLQLAAALPRTLKGGTKMELKWQDGASKVTVSVVIDGKAEIIARDQPGTGGVAWVVPKIDAKGCRIVLEAGDRSWKSPPFEIDSSAPEIDGVDIEIPGK